MNPNKTYDVSPQTRAQILRDMLVGSTGDGNGTSCDNVRVEGTNEHPIEDYDCNGPLSDCFGSIYYTCSTYCTAVTNLFFASPTKNEVVTGYIWRYARTQNAALFFRGIRTWAADGPEERQLQILNSWGPLLLGRIWPLRTIFLEGDPRYRDVSSTRTRMICKDIRRRGGGGRRGDGANDDDDELSRSVEELSRLVPRCVVDRIVEAYGTDS